MLINTNLKQFSEDLAAKKSVPGGGGAAALVGSLAAALSSMVLNFTIGKKEFSSVEEQMQNLLKEAEEAREKLILLVDEDAYVFNELMAVYSMPKNTEEEKTQRTVLLQEKAKKAALVPLSIAENALKILPIAKYALTDGNKNLSSDAVLSAILASATIRSAYYNVIINLNIIKDVDWVTNIKKQADEMVKKALESEGEIIKINDNF